MTSSPAIIEAFKSFITAQDFPCVGAKSALAHRQITFCLADDIRNADCDDDIVRELQAFAEKNASDNLFVSFAVIFQQPVSLDEKEFEGYLWERLQSLHEKDSMSHQWDKSVSSDPASSEFSMSIGGKAFYVVGLHPGAHRVGRRFSHPTLIFNLHSQFETLRANGTYARMREIIIARDTKLNGTENPMLAEHGNSSEARQYSGREVEKNWQCPFHAVTSPQNLQ